MVIWTMPACQDDPYPQGKNLYTFYCANCHMEDGSGLAKLIPPINIAARMEANRDQLPCIIKYGMEGRINVQGQVYNQKMEGFKHLSDAEISNIVNYVLFQWGDKSQAMLPTDVKNSLKKCAPEPN